MCLMIEQNVLIENPYLLSVGVTKFVSREQFIFQALVLEKRAERQSDAIGVHPVFWTACSLKNLRCYETKKIKNTIDSVGLSFFFFSLAGHLAVEEL